MKCRIIERTNINGSVEYVIQQKHLIFRWRWVDACMNSLSNAYGMDSFGTIEEARKNICYFDGSTCTDKVVENC